MAFCAFCGTEHSDGAKYCPRCGEKTIRPMANTSTDQGVMFTPPINSTEPDVVPAFTPPGGDKDGIPIFTPPGSGKDGMPVFTPPVSAGFDGPSCASHPNLPGTNRCYKCGRPICEECKEAYTLIDGPFEGQAFCYDCILALVSSDRDELVNNYAVIRNRTILVVVGVVIGFLFGMCFAARSGLSAMLIWGFVCMMIGGSFANFCRNFIAHVPSMFHATENVAVSVAIGLILFCVFFFIDFFKAMIETISKLFSYGTYLRRTKGVLEQNQESIEFIQSFMEYTLISSQNRGVDLESLMNDNSVLYSNDYAQRLKQGGEAAAEEALRRSTTRITANGEIIRDFVA